MVQKRKAQQKENPGQKQSIPPIRANKKQFTVPHPLSGKLQMAQEAWRRLRRGILRAGVFIWDSWSPRMPLTYAEPNLNLIQPILQASLFERCM
jgi:hypothetical protein